MRSLSAAEHPRRGAAGTESGSVTAEFAAVIPSVILVLALCLGGLQLSTRQLRAQDAAALTARSAARGGSFDAGAVVEGAVTRIERRGNLVCAVVTVPGEPLAGIFPAVQVSASSCSLAGGA